MEGGEVGKKRKREEGGAKVTRREGGEKAEEEVRWSVLVGEARGEDRRRCEGVAGRSGLGHARIGDEKEGVREGEREGDREGVEQLVSVNGWRGLEEEEGGGGLMSRSSVACHTV